MRVGRRMPVTRRKLLSTAAAAALPPSLLRAAGARRRSLTVCSYGGVFERDFRRAVLQPFMRSHPGITVDYYGVLTSAQMLGTLRAQREAPQIDVCLFDIQAAGIATDEGLLTPPADQDSRSSELGVAGRLVTLDHLVLLHAPKAFATVPKSWKVLWDEAHAGKIAIQRPPNTIGIAFTLLANFMEGVTDYRHSYERGIASVARMARNVLNWDPKPDPYAFIVNRSATLGVGWNARARLYSADFPERIAPVLPKEGTIANMNVIAQVRNAPAPSAARQFMGFALSAEAQKNLYERMFYTPVNHNVPNALPVDWREVAQIRDRLSQEWRRKILLRR